MDEQVETGDPLGEESVHFPSDSRSGSKAFVLTLVVGLAPDPVTVAILAAIYDRQSKPFGSGLGR